MLKKIDLRKKLKGISLVNANYSQIVIDRLQNIIKDKIVCTFIPLENEVNINMHLKGQSVLATNICIKRSRSLERKVFSWTHKCFRY